MARKAQMSRVRIAIAAEEVANFGPVRDRGTIIDAGDTTTRTEPPSSTEMQVSKP
jgi:hypothetical protein